MPESNIWGEMLGIVAFGLAVFALHYIIKGVKHIQGIRPEKSKAEKEYEDSEKFYGAPW